MPPAQAWLSGVAGTPAPITWDVVQPLLIAAFFWSLHWSISAERSSESLHPATGR